MQGKWGVQGPLIPPSLSLGLHSVDRTYKLYYGGAQKRSEGLSSRPILDPTGHLMAYIADGSAKDVRNAVEAAHKAAPG